MKTLLKIAGVCLALGSNVFSAAGSETITFDEFTYNVFTPYSPIPNGYHGLNWENFDGFNPYVYQYPTDYPGGVISSPNIAFNVSGDPAAISSSSPFDLTSAYLTAHNDPLVLHVQAFIGATLKYTDSFSLYPSNPQNIYFGYTGIDRVTFSTLLEGKTYGPIFIMDNLVVTVPEPRISALLLSGFLLWGFCRFRKSEKGVEL
jgi:hypothetical protein